MADNLWAARNLIAAPGRELTPPQQFDPATMPSADDVLGTSSFVRGLKSAALTGEAASYASDYYAAKAANDAAAAEIARARAIDAQNQAQTVAPRVQSLSQINGVSDASNWLAAQAGMATPTLAPVIAGGMVGGLGGAALAGRLGLARAGAGAAGSFLGAEQTIAHDLTNSARLGAMNDPAVEQRMTPDEIMSNTALQGQALALPMMAAPMVLGRSIMRGGAPSIGASIAKHMGINAGVGVGVEKGNQAFESHRNPNRDTSMDAQRKVDSAAAFAALGVIPGAMEGVAGRVRQGAGAAGDLAKRGLDKAGEVGGDIGDKLVDEVKDTIGEYQYYADDPGAQAAALRSRGEMHGAALGEKVNTVVQSISERAEKLKKYVESKNLNSMNGMISFLRSRPDAYAKPKDVLNATEVQADMALHFAKVMAGSDYLRENHASVQREMQAIVDNPAMLNDQAVIKLVGDRMKFWQDRKAEQSAIDRLAQEVGEGRFSKERSALHSAVDEILGAAGIKDINLSNQIVQSKASPKVMAKLRSYLDTMPTAPADTITKVLNVINENVAMTAEGKADVSTRHGIEKAFEAIATEAMGDAANAEGLQRFLMLYADKVLSGETKGTNAKRVALEALRDDFDLGPAAESVLRDAMTAATRAATSAGHTKAMELLKAGLPKGEATERMPLPEGERLLRAMKADYRREFENMTPARRAAELNRLYADIAGKLTDLQRTQRNTEGEQVRILNEMADEMRVEIAKARKANDTETAAALEAELKRVLTRPDLIPEVETAVMKDMAELFKNPNEVRDLILGSTTTKIPRASNKADRGGNTHFDGEQAKAGEFDMTDPEVLQREGELLPGETREEWQQAADENAMGIQSFAEGDEAVLSGTPDVKLFGASDDKPHMPIHFHPSARYDRENGQMGARAKDIKATHADIGSGSRAETLNPIDWADMMASMDKEGRDADFFLNDAMVNILEDDAARKIEIEAALKELDQGHRPNMPTRYAARMVETVGKDKDGNPLTTYEQLRTERDALADELQWIDWREKRAANAGGQGRNFFNDLTARGKDLNRSWGFLKVGNAEGTMMPIAPHSVKPGGQFHIARGKADPATGGLQIAFKGGMYMAADMPKMVDAMMKMHDAQGWGQTAESRLEAIRMAVNDVISEIMRMKGVEKSDPFGVADTGYPVPIAANGRMADLPGNLVVLREAGRDLTIRDLTPVDPREAVLDKTAIKRIAPDGVANNAKSMLIEAMNSVGLDGTIIESGDGISRALAGALLKRAEAQLEKAGIAIDRGALEDQPLWFFGKDGEYSVKYGEAMRDKSGVSPLGFDMLTDHVRAAEERVQYVLDQIAAAQDKVTDRAGRSSKDKWGNSIADLAKQHDSNVRDGLPTTPAQRAAAKQLAEAVLDNTEVAEQVAKLEYAIDWHERMKRLDEQPSEPATDLYDLTRQQISEKGAMEQRIGAEHQFETVPGERDVLFDQSEGARGAATLEEAASASARKAHPELYAETQEAIGSRAFTEKQAGMLEGGRDVQRGYYDRDGNFVATSTGEFGLNKRQADRGQQRLNEGADAAARGREAWRTQDKADAATKEAQLRALGIKPDKPEPPMIKNDGSYTVTQKNGKVLKPKQMPNPRYVPEQNVGLDRFNTTVQATARTMLETSGKKKAEGLPSYGSRRIETDGTTRLDQVYPRTEQELIVSVLRRWLADSMRDRPKDVPAAEKKAVITTDQFGRRKRAPSVPPKQGKNRETLSVREGYEAPKPVAAAKEAPTLPALSEMSVAEARGAIAKLMKATQEGSPERKALFDQAVAQKNTFAMGRFGEGTNWVAERADAELKRAAATEKEAAHTAAQVAAAKERATMKEVVRGEDGNLVRLPDGSIETRKLGAAKTESTYSRIDDAEIGDNVHIVTPSGKRIPGIVEGFTEDGLLVRNKETNRVEMRTIDEVRPLVDQSAPFSKQATGTVRTDTEKMRAAIAARKDATLADAAEALWSELSDWSGRFTSKKDADGIVRRLIETSVFAKDPMQAFNHEVWHTVRDIVKGHPQGQKIVDAVYRATSTPAMKKYLEKYFKDDPRVLEQLKDADERAAFAFQLFAAGKKLPLGPESTGALRTLWNKLKAWMGFVEDSVRTGKFFEYIDKGEFAKELKNPEAWLRAVGETRTERYAAKLGEMAKPLTDVASTLFTGTYDRVKRLNNEGFTAIADLYFGRKGEGEGFIYGVQRQNHEMVNKLQDAIRGFTEEQHKQALSYLRTGSKKGMSKETIAMAEEVGKIMAEVDARRVKYGLKPVSNPKRPYNRLDYDMIENHRAEFETDLAAYGDHAGPGAIKSMVDKMMREREMPRDEYGDNIPLFREGAEGDAKFHKWQTTSLLQAAVSHIRTGIEAAEEARINREADAIGRKLYGEFKGNGGKWTIEEIKARASRDSSEQDQAVLNAAIESAYGRYGGHLSPAARKIMGGIIAAENIISLPFGIFTQLLDPMTLAFRKNEMTGVMDAYGRGLHDLFTKGWASDPMRKDKWERFAEHAGTIAQAQIIDSLGDLYTNVRMTGNMHKINNLFFRLNGMESWNRSMHVAATKNAVEFIRSHMMDYKKSELSKRYMDELGLKPEDVKFDKEGMIVLNDKTRPAVYRFVRESIVHPDAATNTLWMNDPHFALIAHMKRFTWAYSNFVLDRAVNEYKHGNLKAMLPLALTVPWGILSYDLSQMVRGDVKGTSGGMGGLWEGVQKSGVLGRYSLGVDVLEAPSQGRSAVATALGPFASDVEGALR